jgi:hypothetical protein
MCNDLQSRCLACYADDCQRYYGASQRVGTWRWWHEPAAEWVREHYPEIYTWAQWSQHVKYRRDKLGWHSRTRQHAPPPREIHTAPPADVIAESVAMSHFVITSAAGVRR